jgi:predicted nucleic acid-binding protein
VRTYIDSSVLLRIVLGERNALVEWPDVEPVSSELIRVECLRAIERYRQAGALADDDVVERRSAVLDALSRFRLVEPSRTVLERAADPFPVYVATLDAIHLATALEVRQEFEVLNFATHDTKLAAAAGALAFTVLG